MDTRLARTVEPEPRVLAALPAAKVRRIAYGHPEAKAHGDAQGGAVAQPGRPEPIDIRGALLEAAWRLFAQAAPGAVSTRQIADASNCSHGMITRCLGGKSKLEQAVVERIEENRVPRVIRVQRRSGRTDDGSGSAPSRNTQRRLSASYQVADRIRTVLGGPEAGPGPPRLVSRRWRNAGGDGRARGGRGRGDSPVQPARGS